MPGLLPHVDPDGLLEFSVVYTDRALNHMSKSFQGVMKDISRILKRCTTRSRRCWCPAAAPSAWKRWRASSRVTRKVLVIRNGWFSYRWTQIFDMGRIPAESTVLKARRTGTGKPGALDAGADRRGGGHHPRQEARRGVCPACGNRLRHDPARRLPARRGRRGARSRRPVRAGLHRLRRDVGRHAGHRRGRAGVRARRRAGAARPAAPW
jgi:hypothetical protein